MCAWMDALVLNTHTECVTYKKEARVLERFKKMYFDVVLKEEAIVRNTTPSGI